MATANENILIIMSVIPQRDHRDGRGQYHLPPRVAARRSTGQSQIRTLPDHYFCPAGYAARPLWGYHFWGQLDQVRGTIDPSRNLRGPHWRDPFRCKAISRLPLEQYGLGRIASLDPSS